MATPFTQAVCTGSLGLAEQAIDDALLAGVSASTIHAQIIEPAMARIGELWRSGALSVADEHLATAISYSVLIRLAGSLTDEAARSRERVLLAAPQGQHHALGLRMAADVLEGAGYEVLFLGADVPLDALSGFVGEHRPAVTGLGFGIVTGVGDIWRAIHAVHDASPASRIMLGGAAVPADLRNAGYPFVPTSLQVLATVDALLHAPPQAPPPPGTPSPGPRGGRLGWLGGPSPRSLTARELQILQLSATGRSRRRIAAELMIGEATVKTHLEHVYSKLGVHDRASAVGHALRRGLIQ